jgi:hypothetical protein
MHHFHGVFLHTFHLIHYAPFGPFSPFRTFMFNFCTMVPNSVLFRIIGAKKSIWIFPDESPHHIFVVCDRYSELRSKELTTLVNGIGKKLCDAELSPADQLPIISVVPARLGLKAAG